jgi:hypothetical protein
MRPVGQSRGLSGGPARIERSTSVLMARRTEMVGAPGRLTTSQRDWIVTTRFRPRFDLLLLVSMVFAVPVAAQEPEPVQPLSAQRDTARHPGQEGLPLRPDRYLEFSASEGHVDLAGRESGRPPDRFRPPRRQLPDADRAPACSGSGSRITSSIPSLPHARKAPAWASPSCGALPTRTARSCVSRASPEWGRRYGWACLAP